MFRPAIVNLANSASKPLVVSPRTIHSTSQRLSTHTRMSQNNTHSDNNTNASKSQPLTVDTSNPRIQCAPTCPESPLRLDSATINQRVLAAEYAVRGQLVIRAEQLKIDLANGKRLPFDCIIQCNIGNPQELGQLPLTFFRQVLALTHYPTLIQSATHLFPREAITRASEYLVSIKSNGCYSNSAGIPLVRKQVAQFIRNRDGLKDSDVSVDHIFLTDGASSAVKMMMQLLIRDENDAIMTPIPQYPLYSATLALLGGKACKYYLQEENNWSLSRDELERSYKSMNDEYNIRAVVVINPGNPTGQCLTEQTMNEIIDFCEDKNLILLADEVYQSNVYDSQRKFTSFKKLVANRESGVQLVSFHSVSKGFLGECGQRGGFMEFTNFTPAVTAQIYKLASISLCSNTSGQLMTGLMCAPPDPSTEAGRQYERERDAIIESLKRRALIVTQKLNECENVKCNPVQGALYAFPCIDIPARAVDYARTVRNMPADTMYCLELLEATGLCVVPGSGFGQRDGTWHFRTTILPGEDILEGVMNKFKQFNAQFMQKWK